MLTPHAREEMIRRQIPLEWVEQVMRHPDQKLPGAANRTVWQSRIESGDSVFLVRCVIEDWRHPPVIVTVYRTSKITNYWRRP